MEVYRSEQEQVEALKKWWDENGRSVLVGVVVALLLVFGWRSWDDYRNRQAAAASAAYQQMVAAAEGGKPQAAGDRGRQIMEQYPKTPYAPMAALLLGRLAVDSGDMASAEAHLRWAMEHADLEEIQAVARLRLARVLQERGQSQQALVLLEKDGSAAFAAPYAEAQGDIHLAMGQRAKAKRFYEQALAGYTDVPQKQALLQMKLDDLADVSAADGQS